MILLSFDIEEFDMPAEYGDAIPLDEQLRVSAQGTEKILDLLDRQGVKATFYCTANFARHRPALIERMVKDGHEVASHGFYHTTFELEHLQQSREALERIAGKAVKGYRAARMMEVPEPEVAKAGYVYNSSINPTFLPGRYNKFYEPRTPFVREGIVQMPASVTPLIRIPLFWLSFHNLPLWLYKFLAAWTHRTDNYLNVYFHPWEFEAIGPKSRYNFPFYVTRNTGDKMVRRLERFIGWAKRRNMPFGTTESFVEVKELIK